MHVAFTQIKKHNVPNLAIQEFDPRSWRINNINVASSKYTLIMMIMKLDFQYIIKINNSYFLDNTTKI